MTESPNQPIDFPDGEKIRFPAFDRVPFEQIFYNPNGALRGSVIDSFYLVARNIVEQIAKGQALEDMLGVAALYLFRHYLELALKGIVYSLRRLETGQTNRPEEDRRKVEPGHPLTQFWNEIKNDCPPKVGRKTWRAWDTTLVDKCVAEFDSIDQNGERFRYAIEKDYGVILRVGDDFFELRCPNGHKFQEQRTQQSVEGVFKCDQCQKEFKVRDRLNPLGVSWGALLAVMEQTHNVLHAIESYLVETYFQNEEWQEEMDSW